MRYLNKDGYLAKCSSCGAACHSDAGCCPSCGKPWPVPEPLSYVFRRCGCVCVVFIILILIGAVVTALSPEYK